MIKSPDRGQRSGQGDSDSPTTSTDEAQPFGSAPPVSSVGSRQHDDPVAAAWVFNAVKFPRLVTDWECVTRAKVEVVLLTVGFHGEEYHWKVAIAPFGYVDHTKAADMGVALHVRAERDLVECHEDSSVE
jgi:hypothetical protein